VIYKVVDERLVVDPIPSLKEVLGSAPSMEITLEEFHSFRRELSKMEA
jgi:hypothetical protein